MTPRNAPDKASSGASDGTSPRTGERRAGKGLARAYAGAIIFALPLFMTMEMWWLGFYMDRLRLALFLLLLLPLLIGLSYHAGFEESSSWTHDVLSAGVALAVGFSAATVVLVLFAVVTFDMTPEEVFGKLALQAIPGSIGALLARSQLGGPRAQEKEQNRSAQYGGELFLMAVGAVFLAFNMAPTEEMVLIASKMTRWHALALAVVSLVMMHAFVYAVEFRGQAAIPSGMSMGSVFLRFTVVGYAVVLCISWYVLWTFGRTDGMAAAEVVMTTVVLAFPAAVGAAAARLII
jgi:putative integral membrane protein (TIGR02587 family)